MKYNNPHHTKKIVTRFPPSPTGLLHLGAFRTGLFNFLYARQHGGTFILRIEDTDKERSKKEYEENIIASMEWLGLSYDEFHRQSERGEIFRSYLKKLVEKDVAYVSKEHTDVEGASGLRSEVIRLRNPGKKIQFHDIIRGDISFDTTELGDFIIAKSFDEPLYHLAVVVDDHEMGVTHVIRGEEHISNTPRQILIGEAIGATRPIYGHLPLILAADRTKLSKRKGARGVFEYRDAGFLPEAILNYVALLGWNPGTDEEIFTLQELVEKFDITRIQKAGAIYNEEKLRWINREHMRRLDPATCARHIAEIFASSSHIKKKHWKISPEFISHITPIVLDRAETFGDIEEYIEQGDFDYFFAAPEYDPQDLVWKDTGEDGVEKTKRHLTATIQALTLINKGGGESADDIKTALWNYATEHGRGNVLWPIRFALTGKTKSPDPFTVASILGITESINRLETAIKKLRADA